MSHRARALTTVVALTLLGACGGGDGSKIFGEPSGPCPSTVLTNDADDAQKMENGTACFLAEADAGRAVIWDVLVPTVEGDPIPTRYDFDGESTTITIDSTRDSFGRGDVSAERCNAIRQTNRLPEGTDCTGVSGDGFDSDSLPGGS